MKERQFHRGIDSVRFFAVVEETIVAYITVRAWITLFREQLWLFVSPDWFCSVHDIGYLIGEILAFTTVYVVGMHAKLKHQRFYGWIDKRSQDS